jgi:predicted  nucleic acid-binding Zn-ribbon protein
MLRDLEYLIQLQEIDLKIHEQELAKELLPAMVTELEQTVEKAKKTMEAVVNKAEEAEKELGTLGEQAMQAQSGLERSQTRLNSIKTNREYDAVHAEIEAQKNIIHTSESRKKKLTEEAEQQKALAETARQEFENIKNENDPKIAELKTKIASIDSVIAAIEKERASVTPLINKSMLRTYDLIGSRRKNGRVISCVDEARTCMVCHKVLESQLMNEIKRSSKLILCQNCGSIFIWTEKPKSPDQAS